MTGAAAIHQTQPRRHYLSGYKTHCTLPDLQTCIGTACSSTPTEQWQARSISTLTASVHQTSAQHAFVTCAVMCGTCTKASDGVSAAALCGCAHLAQLRQPLPLIVRVLACTGRQPYRCIQTNKTHHRGPGKTRCCTSTTTSPSVHWAINTAAGNSTASHLHLLMPTNGVVRGLVVA